MKIRGNRGIRYNCKFKCIFSNFEGITLVALVITIIILFILAGISISVLTEIGLFEKAKFSKEEAKKAQLKEEIELAIMAIQTEELEKGNNVTLETLGNGQLEDKLKGIYISSNNDEIIGNYKGYSYIIDNNLKVIIGEEIKDVIEETTEISNLNQSNIKSFEADGDADGCTPNHAIDGNMTAGKDYNWYGGTRLLIEYNTLSTIEAIGVYTTDNWGYAFSQATIYYSVDDSLVIDSDLTKFKSLVIDTESDINLNEKIKAKRVMLIKTQRQAVYEFRCLGKYQLLNISKLLVK